MPNTPLYWEQEGDHVFLHPCNIIKYIRGGLFFSNRPLQAALKKLNIKKNKNKVTINVTVLVGKAIIR